jgi:hypothetical protein
VWWRHDDDDSGKECQLMVLFWVCALCCRWIFLCFGGMYWFHFQGDQFCRQWSGGETQLWERSKDRASSTEHFSQLWLAVFPVAFPCKWNIFPNCCSIHVNQNQCLKVKALYSAQCQYVQCNVSTFRTISVCSAQCQYVQCNVSMFITISVRSSQCQYVQRNVSMSSTMSVCSAQCQYVQRNASMSSTMSVCPAQCQYVQCNVSMSSAMSVCSAQCHNYCIAKKPKRRPSSDKELHCKHDHFYNVRTHYLFSRCRIPSPLYT